MKSLAKRNWNSVNNKTKNEKNSIFRIYVRRCTYSGTGRWIHGRKWACTESILLSLASMQQKKRIETDWRKELFSNHKIFFSTFFFPINYFECKTHSFIHSLHRKFHFQNKIWNFSIREYMRHARKWSWVFIYIHLSAS